MVIHGLTTVNGGDIKQFNKRDIFDYNWNLTDKSDNHVVLEILYPKKHNPNAQIVCYYFWDKKASRKIEVTIYRVITTGEWGSEIYYFKNKESLQHYQVRHYRNFANMPEKYYNIVKWIHPCFLEIFQ